MSTRYTARASQANSQLHIENVVARILSETQEKTAGKIASWKKPSGDLRRLLRHDYIRSLRKNLPYQELKALIAGFSNLLPGFKSRSGGDVFDQWVGRMGGGAGCAL